MEGASAVSPEPPFEDITGGPVRTVSRLGPIIWYAAPIFVRGTLTL
jgi:hypothetical protein